jgi:type I restriction enzyme S subunit
MAKSGRASLKVPEKYIVRDGDFLFSWSGSLLAKFWTGGTGALNQHLFKVTSEGYPMWFVSRWIHRHIEAFQAIASSKATTMGHIQRRQLKEAKVVCAPDPLMTNMDRVMSPIVEKQIRNSIQSGTLAAIRDALLPKLVSGMVRIPNVAEGAGGE